MNEVKATTFDYIEASRLLGYSAGVRGSGPGIAKASWIPADGGEGMPGSTVIRSVLGELDALITERAPQGRVAFAWGTPERGGARLMRSAAGPSSELLRISWNHSEIECIGIESRNDMSFCSSRAPEDPTELMRWLVPRLWAHIRRGGELPVGIDRFADFF